MLRSLSLPGLRLLAGVAVVLTLAAMSGTPAGHAPLGAAAAPQPAFTNDNFNSPGLILPPPSPPGLALFPWDGAQSTVGATLEPNETAPCAPIGASVWYIIAADRPGTLEISTSASNFDTVLSVYTYGNGFLPSPPGGNLVSLGCNDDSGGTASTVAVHVQRYGQYWIQVAGKNGAAGDLRMHIECNPACRPPNDDQAYPTPAYVNSYTPRQSFLEDTTAATLEAGEPRPCGNVGATIWYQFYANQDLNVVLDTASSNFDTVIAAYTPAGLIFPSPPGGAVLLGCNDNAGGGTQSRLTFVAAANTSYWLQVGGASGATGSLVFNVSCEPACPPQNDPFGVYGVTRPPISDDVNTAGATDETGEQHPCGGIAKTVWYGVAVPGNASVAVITTGSDFDTVVAVYELPPNGDYSVDAVHNIVCVDDAGSKQSQATFAVVAGQAYYVQIGGHAGASGNLHVNIDCTPTPCPPPNDTSGAPAYIGVPDYLPHTEVVDTRGATVDAGEPLDCGAMGKTVWYQIDARVGAHLLFDTAGSDFPTALALYQGEFSSPPGALHRVGCATSTDGERARLQFEAPRFSTLWLQVGGMSAASGELQLLVNCAGPCPPRNDFSDSALQIWAAPEWSDAQNTRAASTEPGEPHDCGNSGSTVWYSLYASSGDLHFSMDGSSFPTSIAVYAIEGMSPPGGLAPAACSTTGALDFTPSPGVGYLVQVGGVGGANGDLQLRVHCSGDACPERIIGPDTGPRGATGGGIRGSISLPNTGTGGYLPGATD